MSINRFKLLNFLLITLLISIFSGVTIAFEKKISCTIDTFSLITKPNGSLSLTIDSASIVEPSGNIPKYCDVKGHILTSTPVTPTDQGIRFEIKMPTQWNRKFLMFGNGGVGGSIEDASTGNEVDMGGKFSENWGLDRGYAIAATDTGHVGSSKDFTNFRNPDGTQNVDRIINWGYRAIHLVAITSPKIIHSYYKSNLVHSYFMGFSTGGRQALMEAQRYPNDFDGIFAGAPSNALVETMIRFILSEQAQYPIQVSSPVLTSANIALLGSITFKKCYDINSGLIVNPKACGFNPSKDLPICHNNIKNNNCFTQNQIKVLNIFYGKIKIPKTREIDGLFPGYENYYWPLWLTGKDNPNLLGSGIPTVTYLYAQNHLRYFVYNDLSVDLRQFNLMTHANDLFMTPSGINLYQITEANNPNLSSFKARGGKLILLNGLADPIIPAEQTIKYYKDVIQSMENRKKKTSPFIRLFVVPGMDHTSLSPFLPTKMDPLTTLENWVENNIVPNSIITYRTNSSNDIDWTYLVCAYPKIAVLSTGLDTKNSAIIHNASNFHCTEAES